MFFSETLDDKPFRLFVQRTWHLMQKDLALSPVEKRLAFLIEEHPEVGIYLGRESIEISKKYQDELNPILFLAALWQVQKQIDDDVPKGFSSLVKNSFPENMNEPSVRTQLAKLHIDLYFRAKSNEHFLDTQYLEEMRKMLEDPLYFEKENDPLDENPDSDRKYNLFQNVLGIDYAYSAVVNSLRQEADSKMIQLKMGLRSALGKLPSEWLNAIAIFWHRPAIKLKRDRIQDLCEFLLNPHNIPSLAAALNAEEKKILSSILKNDGYMQYSRLVKRYDDESGDDYWWTKNPPKSIVGKLRSKGFIYIGRALMKSRYYKIAVIPKDMEYSVLEAIRHSK
ncbi:DUF1841 family protein [candidate division KSB1 bacterium]|nr:DUF1841 family protein [candidate division KSB1 bacterium]